MRKVLVILVALALLIGTQIVVANAAVVTFRRLFGGPSDDVARGIFVDSSHIYIVGRTRSTISGTWDLFLWIFNRADNSFKCRVAVDIGGADDFGQAVVAYTSMGVTHVYVIGHTDYTVSPYSPPNILLVKFNTDCQVIAAKVYDIDFGDIPYGLTISPDGYLYIAGMSSSAAHLLKVETSNLNIVWARSVRIAGGGDSANSVTISGNKLYVTGRTFANDLFVAKFDATTGDFVDGPNAYKVFSTPRFEEGRDIVVADGKVYVAGIHQLPTGNQEFLFMKLDPNTLNQELAKAFGTSGVEDIFSLSMVGGLAYAVGYSSRFGSPDVVLFAVNPSTGVLSHAFVLGDGATDQAAYDSASTGTCLIYTGATNDWSLSYRVLDLDEVNDATIGFSTPSVSPSNNLVTPTSISVTWTIFPITPILGNYDAFYSWFCPDALVVSTTTTSTVLTTSTLSTTVTSVVGSTTTVYDVRTTTITQTSVTTTTTTSSTTTTLTQTATTTRTETTTLTQSTTYSTTYSTTTTLSTTLTYSTTTTLSTTTTSTQYFAEPVSTYVLPALLAVIAALLGASLVVGRRRRALPY
jgi:hypothetical protein